MNVWKIDVFTNTSNQVTACCTLLVRGNTEAEATQSALDDAKARSIHDSPHVVLLGLASQDEARRMTDQDMVLLIKYGH